MEQLDQIDQGLQDFIFTSKYARWVPELKRRETWDEAVTRVEDMHLEKYNFLDEKDKNEIRWAFSMVREKRVLPSMRSMQFGGKAQLAHEARGYNCLDKNTTFITRDGVKSFNDYIDGDSIQVLSHNGIWRNAVVRNYGKQTLYPINISKKKNKFTIWATKDHRWLLKNQEVTQSIKAGDLLLGGYNVFSEFDYDEAEFDERIYWAYGYVYGDGTKVKSDKTGEYKGSLVRLCGLEKQRYLHRFIELGFKSSEPLSCKGDAFAYTGTYLKTCPNPEIDDPRLIRAFVRGYLDADGAKDKNANTPNKFISIQSSELSHIEFIRKCFPIAGAYIISETELTGQVTNYGVRPYTISFRINTAPQRGENSNNPFRVDSIGEESKHEDVWCLEVEEDASFTLPNGLVTGNCCVRHIDSIRAFAEIGYLMLCGCGTGIGLSKHFLSRLPNLVGPQDKTGSLLPYVIEDTIEGWADAIEALLQCYFKNTAYSGRKIAFDYSKIRRKGTVLKTGGGKAPGYKPLKTALTKIKKLLDRIIEEDHVVTMRPIHAYDVLMLFADAVLSGGIRRTASSVVFDKDDQEMMTAKTYFEVEKYRESFDEETNTKHLRIWVKGHYHDVALNLNDKFEKFAYEGLIKNKKIGWKYIEPQRGRSNNSVLLIRGKTTREEFRAIVANTRQFGEPGFVWANNAWVLYNPCYEVGFIPVTDEGQCGVQFCNLTSANGNKITTIEEFMECIRAQAIIGTLQAGYTNFPYLSKVAKELTEQEALIGLSITGVLSSPDILLDENNLKTGASYAVSVNEEWAKKIGINPAARTTLEKPEGTGSLAVGVKGPGIHADHAKYFFKRIQENIDNPAYQLFKKFNPHMCEPSVWNSNGTDEILTLPMRCKEGAMVKDDLTAIKHLDIIKGFQKNWVLEGAKNNKKDVTNNVSCTVIVREKEWEEVIDYIYDNRSLFSAVSLLDYSGDKDYPQAPFEKVVDKSDWDKYNMLLENYVPVDFTQMNESGDETTLTAESSCAGGACMI